MSQDTHAGETAVATNAGQSLIAEAALSNGGAEGVTHGDSPAGSEHAAIGALSADDGQSQDQLAGGELWHSVAGSAVVSPEIGNSVRHLAEIALQLDDPVAALEEGADALAEALAERDLAIAEERQRDLAVQHMRSAQAADFESAYRHARLHRIGELVDLGYSLDQAVAVTSANEAEVRARALAAGRNPEAIIYQYAMMHGYQPPRTNARGTTSDSHRDERRIVRTALREGGRSGNSVMERLAAMSDEEFAAVTGGDKWRRLLQSSRSEI